MSTATPCSTTAPSCVTKRHLFVVARQTQAGTREVNHQRHSAVLYHGSVVRFRRHTIHVCSCSIAQSTFGFLRLPFSVPFCCEERRSSWMIRVVDTVSQAATFCHLQFHPWPQLHRMRHRSCKQTAATATNKGTFQAFPLIIAACPSQATPETQLRSQLYTRASLQRLPFRHGRPTWLAQSRSETVFIVVRSTLFPRRVVCYSAGQACLTAQL